MDVPTTLIGIAWAAIFVMLAAGAVRGLVRLYLKRPRLRRRRRGTRARDAPLRRVRRALGLRRAADRLPERAGLQCSGFTKDSRSEGLKPAR